MSGSRSIADSSGQLQAKNALASISCRESLVTPISDVEPQMSFAIAHQAGRKRCVLLGPIRMLRPLRVVAKERETRAR
jgi:hypothetical protein